jgi:hypothetical protein
MERKMEEKKEESKFAKYFGLYLSGFRRGSYGLYGLSESSSGIYKFRQIRFVRDSLAALCKGILGKRQGS